jgi:NAD-dependent deacetylase
MSEPEIERARRLLADASRVLVLTGAGVSADSGVPTFRGPDGLWKQHRPEQLATPGAFARDPRLVWEWYGWRREIVAGCSPNAAHRALARWAIRRTGIHIVTQNVDGLHGLAADEAAAEGSAAEGSAAEGSSGRRGQPLELHGSLFRVRCTGCGEGRPHRGVIDATSLDTLPRCEACGCLLRPAVVWFGEPLPEDVLVEAFGLADRADACLVIGTSAVVQPAASLATAVAHAGGLVFEVNPDPTALTSSATIAIRARAAEAVPGLVGDPD